jgi:hypothetical protein
MRGSCLRKVWLFDGMLQKLELSVALPKGAVRHLPGAPCRYGRHTSSRIAFVVSHLAVKADSNQGANSSYAVRSVPRTFLTPGIANLSVGR